jgi:hypothetical protein
VPQASLQARSPSSDAESASFVSQRREIASAPISEHQWFSPPQPSLGSNGAFSTQLHSTEMTAAGGDRKQQLAAEALKWSWRNEGRRALCQATWDSLADFRGNKLHKHQVVRRARGTFRGDPGTADEAVNEAVGDYIHGLWSEDQCPKDLGHPSMAKGTIGTLVGRKPDQVKPHQSK